MNLNNINESPTNAKIHFGYVARAGGVRYLGTTKSSDFV